MVKNRPEKESEKKNVDYSKSDQYDMYEAYSKSKV